MRWKMNPSAKGLASITEGHPGYCLSEGKVRIAMAYALPKGAGWYWVVGWDTDLPKKNTCEEPVKDSETAKADAMAYVRKCMKEGSGQAAT